MDLAARENEWLSARKAADSLLPGDAPPTEDSLRWAVYFAKWADLNGSSTDGLLDKARYFLTDALRALKGQDRDRDRDGGAAADRWDLLVSAADSLWVCIALDYLTGHRMGIAGGEWPAPEILFQNKDLPRVCEALFSYARDKDFDYLKKISALLPTHPHGKASFVAQPDAALTGRTWQLLGFAD